MEEKANTTLESIIRQAAMQEFMVEYICQHREPVKLLLCRSEGTSYERFVHNMVEVEVEYTFRYMDVLRRLGRDIPMLDRSLCHIIASGMFNGIFEVVVHDMPRSQAGPAHGAGAGPGCEPFPLRMLATTWLPAWLPA